MRRLLRTIVVASMLAAVTVPVSAAAVASSTLADTAWPMFGHDRSHTGRATYKTPANNNVRWSFEASSGVPSSPAIGADGTVYFGTRDGTVYAVGSDGVKRWSYTTGGLIVSSPALASDGTIYVGSHDRKLYALDPDGAVKWTYTAGGYIPTAPAIAADGTIYIGSSDHKLSAIRPDGSLKWAYTIPGSADLSPVSPAIAADGTIVFGDATNKLWALTPSGALKWSYSGMCGSPSIGADGTIYVGGGAEQKLHAVTPQGVRKWTYAAGGGVYSAPAIASDGTVYFGSVTSKKLFALTPAGSLKWSYTISDIGIVSHPAVGADGTVAFGGSDGKFYVLKSNGSLKWSYTGGGMFNSSPAISGDGTIYAGNENGKLYAFGPRPRTVPVAGANRYLTSIKASQAAFSAGSCDSVILSTGRNYPDALAAAGLAGAADCPILLVDGLKTTIDSITKAEIDRLTQGKASRTIYITGDPTSISGGMETSLKSAYGSGSVVRLKGTNRFRTAEAIAREAVSRLSAADTPYSHKVFVVTGTDYHDAELAGPAAFRAHIPILLVKSSVDTTMAQALSDLGATDAVIIGSTTLVPAAIQSSLGVTLKGAQHVSRPCSATDPYAQSIAVASWEIGQLGFGWNGVGLATGERYPDALGAGPLLGVAGAPLLFTPTASLDSRVRSALAAQKSGIDTVRYFGDGSAISWAARDALELALQ